MCMMMMMMMLLKTFNGLLLVILLLLLGPPAAIISTIGMVDGFVVSQQRLRSAHHASSRRNKDTITTTTSITTCTKHATTTTTTTTRKHHNGCVANAYWSLSLKQSSSSCLHLHSTTTQSSAPFLRLRQQQQQQQQSSQKSHHTPVSLSSSSSSSESSSSFKDAASAAGDSSMMQRKDNNDPNNKDQGGRYTDDDDDDDDDNKDTNNILETMCKLLHVEPINAIRLDYASSSPSSSSSSSSSSKQDGDHNPTDNNGDHGVRGVYLNHSIQRGEVVLSIPLQSCFVDRTSPQWMLEFEQSMVPDDDDDDDVTSYQNPSTWATRLAASVIELELQHRQQQQGGGDGGNMRMNSAGHELWLSMLPPQFEYLKASLPVHWSEEILQSTKCTALEMAVDSAYFARAQAIEDLVWALKKHCTTEHATLIQDMILMENNTNNGGQGGSQQQQHYDDEQPLRELCNHALDIVQTRSCRLERLNNDDGSYTTFRVLAPIFDMINHGSNRRRSGPNSANAEFELQLSSKEDEDEDNEDDHQKTGTSSSSSSLNGHYLVVRATRNLMVGEELLIDYGPSTHPAWKCLLSYGFVPTETEDEVAEVYMDGKRYEVGTTSIPVDMVVSAIASLQAEDEEGKQLVGKKENNKKGIEEKQEEEEEESEIVLTPQVATRLSRCLSDAAYDMILEPEPSDMMYDDDDDDDDDPSNIPTTPFQVMSYQLATSLRWSQHRILLACAKGLEESAQ